jgi:hypothetical protein
MRTIPIRLIGQMVGETVNNCGELALGLERMAKTDGMRPVVRGVFDPELTIPADAKSTVSRFVRFVAWLLTSRNACQDQATLNPDGE